MVYLDYSATTPVDEEVLESFNKVIKTYIANPNSLHNLGVNAKELHTKATKQIADILNIKEEEIIYTSGASESNNLALKGIAMMYKNRGNHIITTKLEHSSIIKTCEFLEEMGFSISYVKLNKDGSVDLDDLKSLITNETILVSIASCSSELGISQDIGKIGKFLKDYNKVIFHSDITQSIGKEKISLENVDLASLSAQKFYGFKGSGILYKKSSINLVPLIHGGKSTTIYRSGTPNLAVDVSLSKALRLIYENIDSNIKHVKKLNKILVKALEEIEDIHINSTPLSIDHIINFSLKNIKASTLQQALSEEKIYISTQSACSSNDISKAVYEITKDEALAKNSLRVSISHLTTLEEIYKFIDVLKTKIEYLRNIK